MAIPPYVVLDVNRGDRLLGPDQVADLLAQAGPDPAFSAPPPIGDTTPNTGAFTTLSASGKATLASDIEVGSGTRTATASAGAATLDKPAGKITSESITTAAAGVYTLTLANNTLDATDLVFASVQLGSSTQGTPQIQNITVTDNQVVITVKNIHATLAFNGTIVISFFAVQQRA